MTQHERAVTDVHRARTLPQKKLGAGFSQGHGLDFRKMREAEEGQRLRPMLCEAAGARARRPVLEAYPRCSLQTPQETKHYRILSAARASADAAATLDSSWRKWRNSQEELKIAGH